MGNTGTLEVMVVPVGSRPYRKVLKADGHGSFLRALQACVGGPIESGAVEYLRLAFRRRAAG